MSGTKQRMIVWFSCGAASAVAAKESIRLYGESFNVEVVCCDTRPSEHIDNYRFAKDVEKWIGQKIIYIRNKNYADVDEVFAAKTYMSGINGAVCTGALKREPRIAYADRDDEHVFGFTFDEKRRVREFTERNPELYLRWVLVDLKITKQDCYRLLGGAGIRLPTMYLLGFNNNNCPGCVKASSPWYWSMVRKHFPEVFKLRCEQSRRIGCRLVEIKHHVRIFLDELPDRDFPIPRGRKKENLSCGPECGVKPQLG